MPEQAASALRRNTRSPPEDWGRNKPHVVAFQVQNQRLSHQIPGAGHPRHGRSKHSHRGENMPKTVLVTGASSGIGAAVAQLFHRRGFLVFGTSRSADPGSVREFPMLKLDVNSDVSAKACIHEVLARTGRLAVLVNNAGFGLAGATEKPASKKPRNNLKRISLGCMVKAALPHMRGTPPPAKPLRLPAGGARSHSLQMPLFQHQVRARGLYGGLVV